MEYLAALRRGATQLWRSPGLIGVLFIELVVLFVATLLFSLVVTTSIPVAVGLVAVQLAVFLLVEAFTKAGFSAMMRNAVQDGTTTIREFLPGAKRYFARFLGYLLLRTVAILALLVPYLVSVWIVPPVAGLTAMHYVWLALFAVGTVLVILFWMLWAAPGIVFDDLGAVEAVRRSIRRSHESPGAVLAILLVALVAFLVALAVSLAISLPYQAWLIANVVPGTAPPAGALAAGAAIDVATYVLLAATMVVVGYVVFSAYPRRRSHRRRPA